MGDVNKLLNRGVEEIIIKEHLEVLLKSGKKLRIKFGIDPTAPDLHLGHSVPLRKLRQFQDAGHQIVLIIGDFTAMIGDPSGCSTERRSLTKKEVNENLKKYLKLTGKIFDIRKTEVHYNSEWFKNPKLILELARAGSVQQVLHREDFKNRINAQQDITLLETLYPLFQGYDSVMVKADVEIGGTDQKFNLLMGRKIQRHFNMPEQDILTVPLLEGTDGIKKMSKSYGNYIALDAESQDMFGKIMSIPDNLIDKYYILLTDRDRKNNDPREAKLELAEIIVSMYHGEKTGKKVKKEFIEVFSKKQKPGEASIFKISASRYNLTDLLIKTKIASSKSEAWRLIKQGGVRIDNDKKINPNEIIEIKKEILLQVGRHRFLRITK